MLRELKHNGHADILSSSGGVREAWERRRRTNEGSAAREGDGRGGEAGRCGGGRLKNYKGRGWAGAQAGREREDAGVLRMRVRRGRRTRRRRRWRRRDERFRASGGGRFEHARARCRSSSPSWSRTKTSTSLPASSAWRARPRTLRASGWRRSWERYFRIRFH
ncbi:Hypothetical protein CAP_1118 [Chondromyces apiculatus DSM 436]|uniref:Uncharacterized protein n=1 Tax=Chondromyces apiculatus DSM 436 TaxID=1192034 RepID=A0A017ST66_9BACT|nr:Hypothetical protein CAP_1118 [Chondromyces apiculatus DSM 436]